MRFSSSAAAESARAIRSSAWLFALARILAACVSASFRASSIFASYSAFASRITDSTSFADSLRISSNILSKPAIGNLLHYNLATPKIARMEISKARIA